CPMPADDWCHFSRRVERSSLHRRLKGAELGYEDEKFSYVAVTREPLPPAAARVLRHPLRHPGVVKLRLCAADGLTALTVSRKGKEAWRQARKIDWGDAWE
ncbi:MAG TPA: small ribosomal subunit Rsm22 family protein, partial [Blastocatellia bacterium]|nr:small ribosomal subunit Rsm22 family protein [Blastocatellia bacterium]